MLLSDSPRCRYERAPVHEVICQLRFPPILSIGAREPVDFQEAIREDFPRYAARQETAPPKVTGLGTPNPKVEQQPPTMNYNFLSEDNLWKINLTRNFIALSTLRYDGWEDFAHRLDRPLAEFIRLYSPSFFERIGLRYVNIFSRERLNLTDRSWRELFTPAYLGPLMEDDVTEENLNLCATDFTLKLDNSCRVKLHAGPGKLKQNNPNAPVDNEIKFILDMDLSMSGNIPASLAAGALETLHAHGTRGVEGAITEPLRQAMGPEHL